MRRQVVTKHVLCQLPRSSGDQSESSIILTDQSQASVSSSGDHLPPSVVPWSHRAPATSTQALHLILGSGHTEPDSRGLAWMMNFFKVAALEQSV